MLDRRAERFGEWDAPHPRPEPNKALLLPKKLKQYNKPPVSKSISTLVPADSNRDEFLRKSIAAFSGGSRTWGIASVAGRFVCIVREETLTLCDDRHSGPTVAADP